MGDEDRRYLVCDLEDGTAFVIRGLRLAQSRMEAPDINGWRVFDDELFLRQLTPESGQKVSIGERVGTAPARDEALACLRRYLQLARPERSWDDAHLASLIAATEEANQATRRIDVRRSVGIILVVSLVIAIGIAWSLVRRLTGR